jgi:trimethylamine---corrinoid protein Co-methyltransferase
MLKMGTEKLKSPLFRLWTQEQCHSVHLKSLEILERTGILVHDTDAINIYKKAGAHVENDRVFIPAGLVEEAIRTSPEKIILSRNPYKIRLENRVVNYGLGSDLPFFIDYKTSEIKRTLLQDIRHSTIIADSMPNINFISSLGIASDVTPQLADLYHFKTMLEYSGKPIMMTALDQDNLQGLIDIAAIEKGGYKELKNFPSFLIYVEPISPLVYPKETIQKLMLAAQYNIPVTCASGITSGATGPVTLAGNITLGNAECLAALTLHQIVQPGAPFMYGIVAAPLDMATTLCCYGGPEMPLYFCAVGELGRFYKLPTFGQSGNTDAVILDEQAAIEAMFSIFIAALSGTNFVHDNGYTGNGLIGSLEMILLCDECIGITKSFMSDIDISNYHMIVEKIREAGPGGFYTDTDYSFSYWKSRYLVRKTYKNLLENRSTVSDKLVEHIESILNKDIVRYLSDNQVKEIAKIINEYEGRILK